MKSWRGLSSFIAYFKEFDLKVKIFEGEYFDSAENKKVTAVVYLREFAVILDEKELNENDYRYREKERIDILEFLKQERDIDIQLNDDNWKKRLSNHMEFILNGYVLVRVTVNRYTPFGAYCYVNDAHDELNYPPGIFVREEN